MKALLLAAGYGTRLGKITKKTPKPMIEVAGKPVLEHLVEYLNRHGIFEIIVNTHYKPEVIYKHFGTRLIYSYEPTLLGEEGTVDSLKHWLWKEYTVIMNGDTLTNLNLEKMYLWSKGKNIRSMDGGVYTGTKIISPSYFFGDRKFIDYQDFDLVWHDIGSPEGLDKARKYYEKTPHLPRLSGPFKN